MEILYQYADYHFGPGWCIITTIAVILLGLWIFTFFVDKLVNKKTYDKSTKSFAAGALFIIILVGIVSYFFGHKYEYEVYKVKLDESTINYEEFFEQYEIIDQEGKIYTIKERDNG